MALHAATAEWHSYVGSSLKPFDAAVAFAPSCELQYSDPKLASPLLAMLGEKDDLTLPGPCVKLFERMKAAGQKVAWEVVPNAVHSWSTSGARREPNLYSARGCSDAPLYYTRAGFERSTDGKIIAFSDVLRVCEARGGTVGGPGDKRGYVLERAASWLKGQGW